MVWTNDDDVHVARAIGRAIRHVRRVVNRPHINSDREERLNQFVVTLRREFSQLRSRSRIEDGAYHALCEALAEKKHLV